MGSGSRLEERVVLVALAVTLVLVFVVNKFRPRSWLPDNTVIVFAGITLGLFLQSPSPADLYVTQFSSLFYDMMLPPIVFAAALNQTRHTWTTCAFSLFSIISSTLVIGRLMQAYVGEAECIMAGCLLWGIVLAPVNARYAIASHEIHELEDVRRVLPASVNAWLQSETQLSGPISLVFFSSLMRSESLNAQPLTSIEMFVRSLFGSILVGALFGLFASLTLKAPFGEEQTGSAYRQASLVVLWATSSYFVGRYLGFSPIGSLFATGVVMNNLAFVEISSGAKHAARVGSASLGSICEGIILLYLSVLATSSPAFATWDSVQSHLLVAAACVASRLIVAVAMAGTLGVLQRDRHEALTALVVANLSGIKSVVSFVLALKLGQRELVSSSTFVILFTQCVLAPAFAFYLERLSPAAGLYGEEEQQRPPPMTSDYDRERATSPALETTSEQYEADADDMEEGGGGARLPRYSSFGGGSEEGGVKSAISSSYQTFT